MPIAFDLTPEQEEVRRQAREFAEREIAPIAAEIDEKDELPWDLWGKMAQPPYCYTGQFIPKEYGGYPRKLVDMCLITEELACAGQGAITVAVIEVAGVGTAPIVTAGSHAQKQKWLPPIAAGQAIGCFALTEPGAGSDAAAIETRAERTGDYYVLNGRKRYASFASICRHAVVFAKTDPAKGARGISAFVVEQGTPGFSVIEKVPCIGMHGHQDEEVLLENCRVPAENLLGEEGRGLHYALATLDDTRTTLVGGFIGLARAALEAAVKFAKARSTFGQPIAEYQAIRFPLADISVEIDAARLLMLRAAWLGDQGQRHTAETAAAKAYASEVLIKATNLAVEVHGGFGGTKRFPVERFLRDGRIWVFAQGAPNIMKLIVARDLFK